MFVYLYIHTRVFMLAEVNIAGASLRGRNLSDFQSLNDGCCASIRGKKADLVAR